MIELLVVLTILGVLASAARPLLELQVRRTQELALREALRTLRNAIDAYHDAVMEGRIAREVNDAGYPPDLQTLVQGVTDARSPNGRRLYFLRRLPRDPFANPVVPAEASWGLRSADSPPQAPQAGRDVFDVYSLSDRRALDGSFYRDW